MYNPVFQALLGAAGVPPAGGGTPVVESTANTAEVGNQSSHPVSMPSGVAVGDIIFVFFGFSQVDGVSIDTGASGNNWNELLETDMGADIGVIFWKVAEGSDVLTITSVSSGRSTAQAYRVSGANNITASAATGNSSTANPPSHNAGSSKNYLWIACHAESGNKIATVAPSNYTNLLTEVGTGGGTSTSTARRELETQTEDPSTFTNPSAPWAAFTVAIHPA